MEKIDFGKYYKDTFTKNKRWIMHEWEVSSFDADDILQNTYIDFYDRYLINYDPTICTLDTYFTGYLLMRLHNHKATVKKKRNTISLDVEIEESKLSLKDIISEQVIDNDPTLYKTRIINKIISDATPKIKSWYDILLKYVEGYSYEQLATLYGLNLSTLKSRIRNVRIYINKEYSSITNTKSVFKKNREINQNSKYYRKWKIQSIIERELKST
jgi:RNA polymerase sigma factor (sigma-70 family)